MPLGKTDSSQFVLFPKTLPTLPLPTQTRAADAGADGQAIGIISMFDGLTDPLKAGLTGIGGDLASAYKDASDRNSRIQWLKQVYDQLKQSVNAASLLWEGAGTISTWPTDPGEAYKLYQKMMQDLQKSGQTLDPSLQDTYTYVTSGGQQVYVDKTEIDGKISTFDAGNFSWLDRTRDGNDKLNDVQFAWKMLKDYPNARWIRWPDGKLYHLEAGPNQPPGYLAPLDGMIAHPGADTLKQINLQLYGNQYLAETKRLKDAGLPISAYDAYQYMIGGKAGYTAVNQIKSLNPPPNFSGVPDNTIVAVGKDYYLVQKGQGRKLDAAPTGLLTGLPGDIKPAGNARYLNAIDATMNLLLQNSGVVVPGDYDMCQYQYTGRDGNPQTGYSMLPPVELASDPSYPLSYAPGTLLHCPSGYYRVNDAYSAAKVTSNAVEVTDKNPDFSQFNPGTVVKLTDGKYYWITKDKQAAPLPDYPLVKFMSPERKANWDGVLMTELLQQAGIIVPDSAYDTCVFLDENGNTRFAKLPVKEADKLTGAPSGKDYPADTVVKGADGQYWYIDARQQVHPVKTRMTVVEPKEGEIPDPNNYDPGTVVHFDDGNYYRITQDHQKVLLADFPLEKLICNPSEDQLKSIQGGVQDLMNQQGSNLQFLYIRLQELAGMQNTLATLIMAIVSAVSNTGNNIGRNMA